MNNLGQINLRKGRNSKQGNYYHITSVIKDRMDVFSDFDMARLLIAALKASDENGYTLTQTYCVMPDHFHWLMELKEGSLSQAVARVKADFSRCSGLKIWQDGFHDHGIRSDESLINIARYVVANPLRADVVKTASDYPHWDSIWLE